MRAGVAPKKKAGTLRHRPLIAISRYRQRFRL